MTFVLFEALHVARPEDVATLASVLREAVGLSDARGGWVGPPAAGSIEAGDLICRAEFEDDALYRAWRSDPWWDGAAVRSALNAVARRERMAYPLGEGASRDDGSGGIWRGLMFALNPGAPADEVARLTTALLEMPAHIEQIRGCRLSVASESEGSRKWTHMWEQEFDDSTALRGAYLTHPVHWSYVDGWFDVECPQWIVDPYLVHCFVGSGAEIRL